MDIQDNVFLVTGGASGLGAATAQLIRDHGGKVVLADMNEAAGEKLAKELGGVFVKCDVSREEDGQRAVEAATQLGDRKAGHVAALDADMVVSGNPGCLLQLQSGLPRAGRKLPVRHIVELLDGLLELTESARIANRHSDKSSYVFTQQPCID